MPGSVLQSLEQEVINLDRHTGKSPEGIRSYGGKQPWLYLYPNESQIWIGGMDNPSKVLSSQRDIIYANQGEELALDDVETLLTRCTGRAGNVPYPQMILDVNPSAPRHWLRTSWVSILDGGDVDWIDAKHTDNPTLYNPDTGEITAQGRRTIGILSKLTGARRGRLYLGQWVAAEGMVYEDEYDSSRILVRRKPIPLSWPRIWVIDFGYTNPFNWQCWALDNDRRLIMQKEIYHTQRTVREHCRDIMRVSLSDPRPTAIITDHDIEDRKTFEAHCIYCEDCDLALTSAERRLHTDKRHRLHTFDLSTKPAYKAIIRGIQAVAERLKPQRDGRARIEIMRGALIELDRELKERHLPTCTAEEFEGYIWKTDSAGKVTKKEEPVDKDNHGMDDLRYVTAYVDGLGGNRLGARVAIGPKRERLKMM